MKLPPNSSRPDTCLPGSAENHNVLINATMALLGKEAMSFGRFWRQESGAAYRIERGHKKWVHYGIRGGGDISGIVLGGRRVELEGKTGRAVQSPQQLAFQRMITKFGGIYIVFHSPQEALDLLRSALLG